MDAERDLRLVESLLCSELESLTRYNQILEGEIDADAAVVLGRIRDEQVRRVEALQESIRHYREALDAGRGSDGRERRPTARRDETQHRTPPMGNLPNGRTSRRERSDRP